MTQTPADDRSGETAGPAASAALVPDDKDWTWTLHERCPECGFHAATVAAPDIATRVTAFTDPWPDVLARPGATTRPAPARWSPLEYGCHVRDVCRVFDGRLRLMLSEEAPTFPNWDQDEAAVTQRYGEQDPARVGLEVTEAAAVMAGAFAGVPAGAWERTGLRSNGSQFTVLTLGQYTLHDLAHHLWDVGIARP